MPQRMVHNIVVIRNRQASSHFKRLCTASCISMDPERHPGHKECQEIMDSVYGPWVSAEQQLGLEWSPKPYHKDHGRLVTSCLRACLYSIHIYI